MRIPGGRLAVFALIQKQTSLLPAPQIDVVLNAQFLDRHRRRNITGEHVDPLLQPFEHASPGIVSRQNPPRRDEVVQAIDDYWRQFFHALGQRLDDKVVAVTIDDQRWQKIRFSMNEPEGRGVDLKRRSKLDRRFQSVSNQSDISRHVAVRKHADRDLRSIAVERLPENLTATIANDDDVASASVNLAK